MRQYTLKRIGLFLPTVLLVTIIVFAIMRLVPGDPALAMLEDEAGGSYTQEDLARLRAKLGTDRNLFIQYASWMGGVVRGDFGNSYWFDAPVMGELKNRIPVTIELAVLAILLAMIVAVPLGIVSAIKPDSMLNYSARITTLAGIALPTFFTGIVAIILLVHFFGWLPPLGYASLWKDPLTNLQQMIFPALALAAYDLGLHRPESPALP